MHRNPINNADNFCYNCGEVTFARQRKTIITIVKKAYQLYFGCKIGDQYKSWTPHIYCRECLTNLSQGLNGKRYAMPFAVLMVWRETSNHWLLLLYGATCFWRHHEEKEVDNSLSEYTICSPSSSTRRTNFRSRTFERIYHRFRRWGRRQVDLGFSWAADVYWTTRLSR